MLSNVSVSFHLLTCVFQSSHFTLSGVALTDVACPFFSIFPFLVIRCFHFFSYIVYQSLLVSLRYFTLSKVSPFGLFSV